MVRRKDEKKGKIRVYGGKNWQRLGSVNLKR